jgi:hypothetical protein
VEQGSPSSSRVRAVVPLLAIAALGCNTAPPGIPITARGNVGGHEVAANVGVWDLSSSGDGDAGSSQLLTIALTTSSDAGCPTPGTFAASSVLTLGVPIPAAGFKPGLFPITELDAGDAAPPVFANVTVIDSNCASVLSEQATLGTIALSALTQSQVNGSFVLAFGGDQVFGTFAMPICTLDGGAVVDAGDAGSVCTP